MKYNKLFEFLFKSDDYYKQLTVKHKSKEIITVHLLTDDFKDVNLFFLQHYYYDYGNWFVRIDNQSVTDKHLFIFICKNYMLAYPINFRRWINEIFVDKFYFNTINSILYEH